MISRGNNFMAWVRGPEADYEDWAQAVDDEWWRWNNALTYLKKVGEL